MILAFRRPASPYTGFTCALQEMDDAADYEVTVSPGYTQGPATVMKGSALRALVIPTSAAPESVLVEYRRLSK